MQLSSASLFDDAVLNSLFWIGAYYHSPVDLPDTAHWTELEGSNHPVSGEHLSPIQSTARPRAQPTITSLHRAKARAHRWRRAQACRNRWAIAVWGDRAEDRRRPRAARDVRPGARAGYNACHEEKTMDSESLEKSSAHCNMCEGELFVDQGLWNTEGDPKLDIWADLPPLLLPSSEPVSSVPEFGLERASVLKFGPERASIPKIGPERASVPEFSPEWAPVPEFSPERAPFPEFGPERASVPKFGPERAPVTEFSPERAPVTAFPRSAQGGLPFPSSAQGGLLFLIAALRARRLKNDLPLLSAPPLSSGSPSAHPQPTICTVRAPRVCQSPSSAWLENPFPPPPASEYWTLPRPVDPAAPPWLLAPSSPPWSVHLLRRAPSYLRLRFVLSSSIYRLGTPLLRLRLVPPASSGSSFPLAAPRPSEAPAPPRPSGFPPLHWSPEPSVPPRPSGSSSSPWLIGPPPQAPPPPALPPLVGPLESSALPPPWLLPPSAPLWVTITAVTWFPSGAACYKSLLAPPYFITTLDSVCRPPPRCPSSSRASSQGPTCPSLCCFYGTRTCLPGGGAICQEYGPVLLCFLPCDPRDPVFPSR